MIFGTMAAMILYFVLFGTPAGEIPGVYRWTEYRGAIYYSARMIQTPIARYYYEYSFIPNYHANDYVDEALGGSHTVASIYETDPDLSYDSDEVVFNSSYQNWSTGWR